MKELILFHKNTNNRYPFVQNIELRWIINVSEGEPVVSDWLRNKEAQEHVKQVLQKAGIPLEIKVSSICKQFCIKYDSKKYVCDNAENYIYSDQKEENLRELDQLVILEQSIKIDNNHNVVVELQIPIECKYREGVEFFGFPNIVEKYTYLRFPVFSLIAGTDLFINLKSSYDIFEKIKNSNVALVDFKKSIKISKENLLQNSTGSLYDYITSELNVVINIPASQRFRDIFKKFRRQTKNFLLDWDDFVIPWIKKNVSNNDLNRITKECLENNESDYRIRVFIPIICVNGQLYDIEIDSDSNIIGFKENEYLLTSARLKTWPQNKKHYLLISLPEAPIMITNVKGLEKVLKLGLDWHQEFVKIIKSSSKDEKKNLLIHSLFYRSIVQNRELKRSFRY